MPDSASALNNVAPILCLVFILVVPFAALGIALINTGLGRSRSAAQMMVASVAVLAVAALTYFVLGFAWQGYFDSQGYFFELGGKAWNWIAAERFFLRGVPLNGSPVSMAVWLQMFTVAIAAMIPLGSGVDRWRLSALCFSTALLAGWTYPLFAHWVWGGGWLSQLGANFGLGHGFVDAGGSSTIHAVGGLTALSVAWILGPRRGKYTRDGLPTALPGHNAIYVVAGCLFALVGWIGMNCAGALLFGGVDPGLTVLAAVNTILAASAAGVTAAVVTKIRFGKPDASLSANGWVGGLVASSAACVYVQPPVAVVIGAVAGGLVTVSIEWFELRLGIDDPGGAISAHGLAGMWGALAMGIFGEVGAAGGDRGQFMAQLVGIATLVGFVLPLTYGLNWALDRLHRQRVAVEGERQGLDLSELGAGAYPDFVTHGDDLSHR
jgi:Amt family ammonium transporter